MRSGGGCGLGLIIFTTPNNLVIGCHQLLQGRKIEGKGPDGYRHRGPTGNRYWHILATDALDEYQTAVPHILTVNDIDERQGLIE